MYLAVPGAVYQLYHLHSTMEQGGEERACMFTGYWYIVMKHTEGWTTHLAKILQWGPT